MFVSNQLLVSLFEVVAFGSSTSISHQVQFKELFKDLLEVHKSDLKSNYCELLPLQTFKHSKFVMPTICYKLLSALNNRFK